MSLNAQRISEIYAGKLARKYDFSMPHLFSTWKRKAFDESSLKRGDTVLVFCCGTGLDFPHILRIIGSEGRIIGVDFSKEMLKGARKKIEKHGWRNVELVEADITEYADRLKEKADVGVCTLGMSIIPNFKTAYASLLSNVKPDGEIIIGDMQLASGWRARLNPITLLMSKRYGGTYKGHQNSLELCDMMRRDLTEVKKREFFFRSYYYAIGTKR